MAGTAVKASGTDAQPDAAGSVLWGLGSFPNKHKIAFVSRKPCLRITCFLVLDIQYHVVRLDVGGVAALSERQDDEAAARQMKAACEKSQAVCTSLKKEKKTAAPPKLFDLTALQREANRLYGFTAKQTLDYAQALYEKRLLTYPRTDSKYITSDMEGSTKELITGLCAALPFMQGVKLQADLARICDNSKVTDHHAILPTAEFVKTGFSSLAESEKKLMTLVCAKLLCAVAAPYEYEAVTAVFTCGGYTFTAKGRTMLCEGWREIVVLHQNDEDTAHYVDSIGFQQVPEFLQEQQTPVFDKLPPEQQQALSDTVQDTLQMLVDADKRIYGDVTGKTLEAIAAQGYSYKDGQLEKQQPEATPDSLLTGETVRTPRGNFHITDMSREQIEAAGFGFHHASEDGKYLIMGNGTQAYAIAAEQPQRDNPLKHVEDTIEQNDNNFDGLINNTPQTPTVADFEQRAKAGEAISVTDLAKAVKAEKREQPQKKPSILKKLDEYKKQAAQQPKDKQKEHKKDLEV